MPAHDTPKRLPNGTFEKRTTRLMQREGRRRSERMRWAVLGSTWVHLLALLMLRCSPDPGVVQTQDDDDDVILIAVAREEVSARATSEDDASRALAELTERADVVRSAADAALRRTASIADALPSELQDDDLADALQTTSEAADLLAATAPIAEETLAALQLAASDISTAVDDLSALSLAADALAARAVDLNGTPTSQQVPVQELTPPAIDLSELIEQALATLAPATRPGQADAAQGMTAADADGAPLASTDTPPVSDLGAADAATADREAADEPVVEPEPELQEEDEVEPVLLQKFVHSEEDVPQDAPEHAEYISARDADDDMTARQDVTAIADGQQTDWQNGQEVAPAAPAMKVETGQNVTPAGQPEASADGEEAATERIGGGRNGNADGEGALGEEGQMSAGGAAAAAASGGAETRVASGQGRVAAPGRTGTQSAAGAAGSPNTGADGVAIADARDATDAAQGEASGWWKPMAARVVIPAAPSTPPVAAPAQAATSPTRSDGVAPVQRPQEREDQGANTPEDDVAAAPSEEEVVEEEIGETEERPPAVDPIADLRADLGWGGIDRAELAPRATASGQAALSGMAPTSQQRVLSPDIDLAAVSYVQARGTKIGEYTERIYDLVNANWYELDLSSDDKALGIQGDVTIVFHVMRNGRVNDLSVLRSSGYLPLDQMALAAVPRRLPRIPRAVNEDMLLQQITFHYKNPLVSAPLPR